MNLEQHILPANQINFDKIESILSNAYIRILETSSKNNIILIESDGIKLYIHINDKARTIKMYSNFLTKVTYADKDKFLNIVSILNEKYVMLKFNLDGLGIHDTNNKIGLTVDYEITFNTYFSIPDFLYLISRYGSIVNTLAKTETQLFN